MNLSTFGVADMMELRGRLRAAFAEVRPASFEAAAQRLVAIFRNDLQDADGRPACALVRIYKTHLYADLDEPLQAFVASHTPEAERLPKLRCLVLLATAGDEPEWNDRRHSRGHQAIPLTSEAAVAQAPMVARLIQQLGLAVSTVLRPDPALLLDSEDHVHNVFFVPVAAGSPFIPAQQDFVARYGVQSVIGFGGMLASGDLVTAVLFSKVPISAQTADYFKVIGLNFKLSMLPLVGKPLLEPRAT